MKTLWIAALFFCAVSHADVYMGELKTGKCTVVKHKDFMAYVKQALGDSRLEVEYDKGGACGQSAYLMKKANRKRWAAFPDAKGCACYLNTAKVLEQSK